VEAGQSAVGDLFDWFLRVADRDHATLAAAATRLRPGESGLLALDWNNGNRTILIDPLLGGVLVGQSLATTTAEIYRALIEATAFGARVIVDRLEEHSSRIADAVVSGTVATSPLAMQIYADVLERPIRLARASNGSAAGAAIYAAVAAGVHATVEDAQASMGGTGDVVYLPNPGATQVYARLYRLYRRLHDAFAAEGGLGDVMKDLIEMRSEVRP
jgi:L-ribulokinase